MLNVQGGRMAVLCAGLLLAAGQPARADGPAPVPVAVLPYAPLFGQAPPAAAANATDQVSSGLATSNSGSDFKVVDVAGATPSAAAKQEDGVESARKPVQAAIALLQKGAKLAAHRRLRPGVTDLEHGISQFLANFQGADDFKPLSDGYVQLALAEIRMGNDDKANKALDDLIRLDPDRILASPEVPKELAERHAQRRAALLGGSRGALRIESAPAGARVTIDGHDLGQTPLLGQNALAGDHFVRVIKDGVGSAWRKVSVGDEVAKLSFKLAAAGATGPLADIRRTLAKNTVDDDLAKSIQQLGQDSQADYVIFGAVRKDAASGALEVKSYVLRTKDGAISQLPDLSFDEEMLGASIEVLKLVNDLTQKIQEQTFASSPGTLVIFDGVQAPTESSSGAPTVVMLAPDSEEAKPGEGEGAVVPVEGGAAPRRHHGPVTADSDTQASQAPAAAASDSTDDNGSILEQLRKRRERALQPEKPADTDSNTNSDTDSNTNSDTDSNTGAAVERPQRHAEPEVAASDTNANDTGSGTAADQGTDNVAPSDEEKKVDLAPATQGSDLAALTPEDLEKMKQAESAATKKNDNKTAIIWGTIGGAVGAAAIAVAIYYIVASTKAPSSATAHVSWSP